MEISSARKFVCNNGPKRWNIWLITTSPVLKESLALKGGTAINLTIFNLPRLSVDVDMDYLKGGSRNEMLEKRESINAVIDKFMVSQGYAKSPKTKKKDLLYA